LLSIYISTNAIGIMSVENYKYFPLCKFIRDATSKAENPLIAFAQNCKLKVEFGAAFHLICFHFSTSVLGGGSIMLFSRAHRYA
jgi:hypothetical protein